MDGLRENRLSCLKPAIVLGVVTRRYLHDHPRDARWLSAAEKVWLKGEHARSGRAQTS
jgi:hypothetical protein